MDLHGLSKHSKPKVREVTADDPLPHGWEMIIHPENGWPIFVNHDKKTTSFTDPRPAQPVTRPTEIFREQMFHTPPVDQQRMRPGMDFFGTPHSLFNQNQTLNRQRFPTINRRPESPLQGEWFRRGAGSLSPSQIRRLNQQTPSQHDQRGFGSQRTPGSPGQSRRIPIMVADGHGGYRTLEKDRDLMEERGFSPNQRDSHHIQRQSSYDGQHPVEQHHQNLDRQNSQERGSPTPKFNHQHQPQQQRTTGGRVSNGHHKGQVPSSENKPRTFNIPIQIEGHGRECFVKDETPSEDEGYSQEEYSSQVEDENRNIREPVTSAESPRDKFRNVKNTPRYVSEAHFPKLKREGRDLSDPQSELKNMIINEDAKKETSDRNGPGGKQTYPAPDYPPFPEVCTPGESMEHEMADLSSSEEPSSNLSNSSTVPAPKNSKNDEVKFNMDIKNESIPLPPPPAPVEKEDSGPSGSERSHEEGSTKSSDSEMDISQSSTQPTPLEKIAKIAEKITELGQDVQKFSGTDKTKEYRRIEEYLMRALLGLDKIDTQGDTTIRTERKKAVQKAQSFLNDLENKVK